LNSSRKIATELLLTRIIYAGQIVSRLPAWRIKPHLATAAFGWADRCLLKSEGEAFVSRPARMAADSAVQWGLVLQEK